MRRELDNDSDHHPIGTAFDITTVKMAIRSSRMWSKTDREKLLDTMTGKLPAPRSVSTVQELDNLAHELVEAIQHAMETAVPLSRGCNHSKPGFTPECKEAVTLCRYLRRKHKETRSLEDWEAYREARNSKNKTVQKALKTTHRDRVEEATSTPDGLWKLAK